MQCFNPAPNLSHDRDRLVVDVAEVADNVESGGEVADVSLPSTNPPFGGADAEKIEWVVSANGELIDEERTCGRW